MSDDSMTKKILGNEKGIKSLIEKTEKLDSKIRRLTSEIESLRKENKTLKRELNGIKGFKATFSDNIEKEL